MRLHKNVAKGPEKGPKSSKKKKRDHILGGQNTVKSCNWGGRQGGLRGLLPPSLYVKRGPGYLHNEYYQ